MKTQNSARVEKLIAKRQAKAKQLQAFKRSKNVKQFQKTVKRVKAKQLKIEKFTKLRGEIGPLIAEFSQGLKTSILNVFEEIGDEPSGIEGYTGKDVLVHYIKTWGTTPLKRDWIGWYFQEAVGYQEEKDEYQTDAGTAKQMMAGWRDAVKWDIEQKKIKAAKTQQPA